MTQLDRDRVLEALNSILDPCSQAVGAPVGIVDLGLVRKLALSDDGDGTSVTVTIGVTEFGCMMGGPFVADAYRVLGELPGVSRVSVEHDTEFDWDPEDMSPSYRRRLERRRAHAWTALHPLAEITTEQEFDATEH